ncbi:hypothetical protein F5146DRAFT_997616 [Armillaria mellea]|nr:hypothetical protein F5146DRAFT_997616 [Armillaria mellea]
MLIGKPPLYLHFWNDKTLVTSNKCINSDTWYSVQYDILEVIKERDQCILNSMPNRRKPELEPLWKIKYDHVVFEKHRHISNEESNFESLFMVVAKDTTDRWTQYMSFNPMCTQSNLPRKKRKAEMVDARYTFAAFPWTIENLNVIESLTCIEEAPGTLWKCMGCAEHVTAKRIFIKSSPGTGLVLKACIHFHATMFEENADANMVNECDAIVEGGTHNRLEYREVSNAVVCQTWCFKDVPAMLVQQRVDSVVRMVMDTSATHCHLSLSRATVLGYKGCSLQLRWCNSRPTIVGGCAVEPPPSGIPCKDLTLMQERKAHMECVERGGTVTKAVTTTALQPGISWYTSWDPWVMEHSDTDVWTIPSQAPTATNWDSPLSSESYDFEYTIPSGRERLHPRKKQDLEIIAFQDVIPPWKGDIFSFYPPEAKKISPFLLDDSEAWFSVCKQFRRLVVRIADEMVVINNYVLDDPGPATTPEMALKVFGDGGDERKHLRARFPGLAGLMQALPNLEALSTLGRGTIISPTTPYIPKAEPALTLPTSLESLDIDCNHMWGHWGIDDGERILYWLKNAKNLTGLRLAMTREVGELKIPSLSLASEHPRQCWDFFLEVEAPELLDLMVSIRSASKDLHFASAFFGKLQSPKLSNLALHIHILPISDDYPASETVDHLEHLAACIIRLSADNRLQKLSVDWHSYHDTAAIEQYSPAFQASFDTSASDGGIKLVMKQIDYLHEMF